MSVNGLDQQYIPPTLDGLTVIDADQIYIDGKLVDITNLVPYNGASKPIDANSQPVKTTYYATVPADLVNLQVLTDAITYESNLIGSNFLNKVTSTAQTMASDTDWGTHKITSSAVPSGSNDYTNKSYVDTQLALKVSKSGDTMSGTLDMGTNKVTTSYVPVNNVDLANKLYVDNAVAGGSGSALLASNNVWTGTNNFDGTLFQANNDTLYTIREALVYTAANFTAVSGTIVDLGGGSYRIVGGPNGGTAIISGAFPYKSVLYRITISCAGSIGGCNLSLTQNGTSLFTANITTVYPTYTTITFYIRPPYGSSYDVNWVFYAPTFGGYVYFKNLTIERVKANVNVGLGQLTCENAPSTSTDVANKGYVDSAVAGAGSSLLASNNTWSGTNTFSNLVNVNNILRISSGSISNRKLVLWDSGATYNNDHQFYGFGVNSSVFRFQIFNSDANYVWYRADSATASTEIMRLTGNGAVGIGTTSPNYKLSVSGTGFLTQELNRTGADNFYGVGTLHTLTSATGSYTTGYARAFGGATTIATSSGTLSSASGYYGIDCLNAGIWGSDSSRSQATFYIDNSSAVFNSTYAQFAHTVRFGFGGAPAGYINIVKGYNTNTGYVEFRSAGGTRLGYIGYADDTNLYIQPESGRKLAINSVFSSNTQPYVVLGANATGSVYYANGYLWPGTNYLTPYYGTGLSNTNGGGNGWDTINSRFYTPYAGRWQVNISFYWNSFTAGTRVSLIRYNSAGTLLESRYCALNGGGIGADTTQNYSMVVYSQVGDWWRVQFTSGGSATAYFGGIDHSHMSWTFLC